MLSQKDGTPLTTFIYLFIYLFNISVSLMESHHASHCNITK